MSALEVYAQLRPVFGPEYNKISQRDEMTRMSLCHGWSSGVTAWLTKNVLGISVVEAGCKTLKIEPHLGKLKWVKGSSPLGVVKVKHKRLPNGKIETEVDAPEGVKII